MLERGIAVRQGIGFLRTELPTILATRVPRCPGRHACCVSSRSWQADWRRLDQRIGMAQPARSKHWARQASGMFAPDDSAPASGRSFRAPWWPRSAPGDVFSKGRDFPGAWLGLVPKQISTGDRTILGKISRRGNRYLRVLFVQAAWVVLVRIKNWEHYGLKSLIEAAKRRLHHNVPATASSRQQACPHRLGGTAKGRAFELDEDRRCRRVRPA